MWQQLQKIPLLGWLVGAFILVGGVYALSNNVIFGSSPIKKMWSDAPAGTYAFVLDADWAGKLMQGSDDGKLKFRFKGQADFREVKAAKFGGNAVIALALKEQPILAAAGDLRVLDSKFYANFSELFLPIMPSLDPKGSIGKWFVHDQDAASQAQTAFDPKSLDVFGKKMIGKSMFRVTDDLGEETLEGVAVHKYQLALNESAWRDFLKSVSAEMKKQGKESLSAEDTDRLVEMLVAAKIVLAVDNDGRLHEARWTGNTKDGKPYSLALRVSKHGEPVSIEVPSGALPMQQLISLMQKAPTPKGPRQ